MRAVSAVVPAAGLSSRMGGPNKLLLPYRGTTVVGAVVHTLRRCRLNVIVVTGRDAEQVAAAAAPAQTVFNPDYESGIGSSIACGVRATPEGAVLIALGDMPALRKGVVKAMIKSLKQDRDIIAPVYIDKPDRRGHPVLFGPEHRRALESLSGDEGANSVVLSNTFDLELVYFDGGLSDIDEPNDLLASF